MKARSLTANQIADIIRSIGDALGNYYALAMATDFDKKLAKTGSWSSEVRERWWKRCGALSPGHFAGMDDR